MADWVDSIVSELRRRGKDLVSLDTPENQDGVTIANDIAAGFTPGLGTAMSLRDYERARRDGDYLGMGLSAVGMIPFAAGVTKGIGAMRKGAKVADKVIDATRAYPRADALEDARKNAVKMLGLPENNTAMQRAKAMGFDVDTPTFHGTNADISSFNTRGKGKTTGAGAFFTDRPIVAESYVSASGGGNVMPVVLRKDGLLDVNAKGGNWNDLETNKLVAKRKPLTSMFDELDRNSYTSTDELSMLAKSAGYPGISINNVKDIGPNSHVFRAKEYLKGKYGIDVDPEWSNVSGKQFAEARDAMEKLYQSQKGTVTAIQDPSRIRSRFAAFDPAKADSSDILAGVAGTAITVPALIEALRSRQQQDEIQ